MKKIIKSALSLICSASILGGCSNGCITTTSPRNYPIIKQEKRITKESEIYKYFKEKKLPVEKISKSLEGMIEEDMGDIFDVNIDLSTMHYGWAGNTLHVTKRGSLEIIHSADFFELAKAKKRTIELLTEIYGPKISNMDLNVGKFKNEELEKKEKLYSAYVMPRGGFAFNLFFGHYVKINYSESTNLYALVHAIAHEGTHTLIFNETSIKNFIISGLSEINLIKNNNEMEAINETACDIIAGKVTKYFKEKHLVKGTGLYKNYEDNEIVNKKYSLEINQIIKEYESTSHEVKISKRDELFRNYEKRMKKKFEFADNFRLNEARLAVNKRYSGSEIIESKLNFLYDKLSAKEFIKTIPYLYSLKDLESVCAQLKVK